MSAVPQQPFFDQIGITKVVWFDNLFELTTTPTEIEIVERVATATAEGLLVEHPKLEGLSLEDSAQEWAKQMRARLTDAEIIEFLDRIKSPKSQDLAAKQAVIRPSCAAMPSTVRTVDSYKYPLRVPYFYFGLRGPTRFWCRRTDTRAEI